MAEAKGSKQKLYTKKDIGKMYNNVLSDRKKLENALSRYQPLVYSVVLSYVSDKPVIDDKQLEELADAWVRKVEREGGDFGSLKETGIDMLTGRYSGSEKIDFASISLYAESLTGGKFVAEFSMADGIKLLENMPSLRDRLEFFMLNGHIHPTIIGLAHELLHKQQFDSPGDNAFGTAAKEAQAYLLELLYSDKDFLGIAKAVTDPVYKFDSKEAVEGLNTVLSLYAVGVSHSEITWMVSCSYYDPEKRKLTITEELMRLKKKFRIDNEDLDALKEVYKIKIKNQLLKARLLLFQTIAERFSYDELHSIFIGTIRKQIATPSIFFQRTPELPPKELHWKVVCPANEEFPYDPDGRRSGIIFGFLPDKMPWEPYEDACYKFGIGRWECTEDRRTVISRADILEEGGYLRLLCEQADTLELLSKTALFTEYFRLISTEPLALKILRALISNREMREILDGGGLAYLKSVEKKIRALCTELEKSENGDAEARLASETRRFFSIIEKLESTFEISIDICEKELKATS